MVGCVHVPWGRWCPEPCGPQEPRHVRARQGEREQTWRKRKPSSFYEIASSDRETWWRFKVAGAMDVVSDHHQGLLRTPSMRSRGAKTQIRLKVPARSFCMCQTQFSMTFIHVPYLADMFQCESVTGRKCLVQTRIASPESPFRDFRGYA